MDNDNKVEQLMKILGAKRRKLSDDTVEMIEDLNENEWFNNLDRVRKYKYASIISDLTKKNTELPSHIDVLDSSLNKTQKKAMLDHLNFIESLDNMTENYDVSVKEAVRYWKKALNGELSNIVEKVESKGWTDKVTDEIIRKIEISESLIGDEKLKYSNWINYVEKMPTKCKEIETPIDVLVKNAIINLDKKVFGMNKVKNDLLTIMVNMLVNKSGGHSIGLKGPPGIGKTLLMSVIGDSFNIPFTQISLGGAQYPGLILGDLSVHIGSGPGAIAKAMVNNGCTNGIIFFDEIDKTGKFEGDNAIENALIHIMDSTTNHNFRDNFLPEIPIDLSNIIFVYSMNSTKDINPALLSRMNIIDVDGYSNDDKLNMAKHYFIPSLLNQYNLSDVIINDSIINSLIKRSDEKGVRHLKNYLDIIIKRINVHAIVDKIDLDDGIVFSKPYTVTEKVVDRLIPKKEENISHLMFYS